MKTKNVDEVMTVKEVARYLRVSQSTVWNWCREGKLPAFKVAHQWRVRRSDLNRAIEEQVTKETRGRPPESRKGPDQHLGIS
ncbi:MAG: helix-turn-helix domain-containing protein [Dehalococcoidia bacterium]|nr:helix-turn-helix domain-containing protein [Dehalococcoidia bacterium]